MIGKGELISYPQGDTERTPQLSDSPRNLDYVMFAV